MCIYKTKSSVMNISMCILKPNYHSECIVKLSPQTGPPYALGQ